MRTEPSGLCHPNLDSTQHRLSLSLCSPLPWPSSLVFIPAPRTNTLPCVFQHHVFCPLPWGICPLPHPAPSGLILDSFLLGVVGMSRLSLGSVIRQQWTSNLSKLRDHCRAREHTSLGPSPRAAEARGSGLDL